MTASISERFKNAKMITGEIRVSYPEKNPEVVLILRRPAAGELRPLEAEQLNSRAKGKVLSVEACGELSKLIAATAKGWEADIEYTLENLTEYLSQLSYSELLLLHNAYIGAINEHDNEKLGKTQASS